MLKVFLSAVATGAVVLAVLNGIGFVELQPKAALYAADIIGGLIPGIGSHSRVPVLERRLLRSELGAAMRCSLWRAAYSAPSRSRMPSRGSARASWPPEVARLPFPISWEFPTRPARSALPRFVLALLEGRRSWQDEMGLDVDGDVGWRLLDFG